MYLVKMRLPTKGTKVPLCYAHNNAVLGINNFLDDTKKVRQSRNDFFKATILTKKRMNEFNFTTMISQVDFFCSFFEEIEDTKKTFRN